MLPVVKASDLNKIVEVATRNIADLHLGSMSPSITDPMVHEIVERNFKKYFKTKDMSMIATFNNFGQRCDDFKTDHEGKLHVLYAGCSFTYAEGVPIDRSWSGLVHKYINENIQETSGYFNVGRGGANFRVMENQIAGYIKYAGKPDLIVINLPEIGREHIEYFVPLRTMTDKTNNIHRQEKQYLITIRRLRERLENFVIWCNLAGIKVIIGCWTLNNENYKELSNQYINPFYSGILDVIDVSVGTDILFAHDDMGYPELEKEILDSLDENDPLRNIVYLALDDAHPGLLGHSIMASHFINKLKEVI